MVTPRRTRLLRVSTLQSFQAAIVDLVRAIDPWAIRGTALIVPTRAAAEQLRRTLEELTLAGEGSTDVLVIPELLTRDDWYRAMTRRAPTSTPLLSDLERYVGMLAAARSAVAAGSEPPFSLRPGLIPAIVSFYDDLMRNQRSIDSFERLIVSDLEPSVELDRGARRLLRQTHFLVATFRAYQSRLTETDRLDEHRLRQRLVDSEAASPFDRVIVTVADRAAESDGFWPADYDLLARVPGLEQIDLVATDAVLRAGFNERVVDLLPGIEESQWDGPGDDTPTLVAPVSTERPYFVWRDREEELLGVLQSVKAESRPVRGREAVVFQRPLPYLYLARHQFARASVPFEARDALPLASEPYAAAVDLVTEFVTNDYDRSSTVELLRSPHFRFLHDGQPLGASSVQALDHALREVRYEGGRGRIVALADTWSDPDRERGRPHARYGGAIPAAVVAATLATELQSLEQAASPSGLLETLTSFLMRYGVVDDIDTQERSARVRVAIQEGLSELGAAHRAIDDTPIAFSDLMMSVRRWIETQTVAPTAGSGGIQLVDARAARYGRFWDLFIVGLVDDDWPERPSRSIFYPTSLLSSLGWAKERDRRLAAQAHFSDLVRLSHGRVSLSTFSMEDDAVVAASAFLEQLDETELAVVREPEERRVWVTPDEALARTTVRPDELSAVEGAWLALRQQRPPRDERFRGTAGASRIDVHSVSALERYTDCPFKYFSRHELGLVEEPDDALTLTSRHRGLILHELLETFYSERQRDGEGAITLGNVDRAIRRFREMVEDVRQRVPPLDWPILKSWLLGSVSAPGLIDQLCLLELTQPVDVVERLIEMRVDGSFMLRSGVHERTADIRGVADRIDLLSDGTFRVIDYKTNRAPHRGRALQLPLYARCAEQQLDGYHGRSWSVSDAAYVAFGEPRMHVPLTRHRLDDALRQGEARAVEVLERIEHGVFPPRPAEPHRCGSCSYVTVCRKDYVADDEEEAEEQDERPH